MRIPNSRIIQNRERNLTSVTFLENSITHATTTKLYIYIEVYVYMQEPTILFYYSLNNWGESP